MDRHVLNRIEWEYQKRPHEFLPAVHDGTIPAYIYRNDGMGQPEDYGLALRSNELVSGRLVPATMKGINLQTEDDYLVHLIRSMVCGISCSGRGRREGPAPAGPPTRSLG